MKKPISLSAVTTLLESMQIELSYDVATGDMIADGLPDVYPLEVMRDALNVLVHDEMVRRGYVGSLEAVAATLRVIAAQCPVERTSDFGGGL